MVGGYKTDIGGSNKRHRTLHCMIYRPSEPKRRNENINTRNSTQFNVFPYLYTEIDKGLNVGHNPDIMKKAKFRARNVTFDLESVQTSEQEISQGEEEDDDVDNEETHKSIVQSIRLLKVKLNFNPLRKTILTRKLCRATQREAGPRRVKTKKILEKKEER